MCSSPTEVPKQQDVPHMGVILWRSFIALLLFVSGVLVLGGLWLASLVKLAIIRAWVGVIWGRSLELLSPMDAMMLLLNPERFTDPLCPLTFSQAIVVKGTVNLPRFCKMVQDRLLGARKDSGAKKFPNLSKRVVQKYGYFVWEDDEEFTVTNHVRLHTGGYSDNASLVQLLQTLQPVPLPKQHPLWEFLLVPKVVQGMASGEEEYAIIIRIHHCMADGVYTMLMMTEMGDQDNADLLPDFNKSLERKLPMLLQKNPFLRYLAMPKSTKLTLQSAINITINFLEILVMIPWYASENMFFKEEKNALSLPTPVLSGRKLMEVSNKIDLQLFKDIANGNDCTVNDVLLRCVTEALRRCNAAETIATDRTVRVVLPMFLYPPSPSMQNGTSICTVILPLHNATSSLDSLKIISKICREVKTSLAPLCHRLTASVIVNCLPPTAAKYLIDQMTFTMMASNMCCPMSKISYMGDYAVDTFFMPPSSGKCAVYFGLVSFKDKVRISVVVDRMVAPSDDIAKQLIIYIEDELRNLHSDTKQFQYQSVK